MWHFTAKPISEFAVVYLPRVSCEKCLCSKGIGAATEGDAPEDNLTKTYSVLHHLLSTPCELVVERSASEYQATRYACLSPGRWTLIVVSWASVAHLAILSAVGSVSAVTLFHRIGGRMQESSLTLLSPSGSHCRVQPIIGNFRVRCTSRSFCPCTCSTLIACLSYVSVGFRLARSRRSLPLLSGGVSVLSSNAICSFNS